MISLKVRNSEYSPQRIKEELLAFETSADKLTQFRIINGN